MISASTSVETVTPNQKYSDYLACVGLIIRKNKIFVTERKACQPMPFFWEFPGGKLEINELPFAALARELAEEVAIHVEGATQVMSLQIPNSEKWLAIWVINQFQGEPRSNENQPSRWVDFAELKNLNILPANDVIIHYIQQAKLLS